MISIDMKEVERRIPPEWLAEAKLAMKTLRDADRSSDEPVERKKARKAIIDSDNYQKIWKKLNPILSDISCHKCWYCETNVTCPPKTGPENKW